MISKILIKFMKGVNLIGKTIQYSLIDALVYILSLLNFKQIPIIDYSTTNDENYLYTDIVGEIKAEDVNIIANKIKNETLLIGYTEHKVEIADFVNLYEQKNIIISSPYGKLGITVFNGIKDINVIESLKRKHELKRNAAELTLAYIKTDESVPTKILNLIGRNGFDVVVCTNSNIKSKKYFRNNTFKETRVFYSIGKVDTTINRSEIENSDLFIKLSLKYDAPHKKIAQEYYTPFVIENNDIAEINVKNTLHNEKYNIINSLLHPLHCKAYVMTLNELTAHLNIKLPLKYAYMSNYTINGICSRTGEIAPGSVFFFRQQFSDKNDLKKHNEFFRLRLYIRAALRKARFVFSYRDLPTLTPWMKIKNPMEAHIKAIDFFRKKVVNELKVIAITGSIGKTSTKDMIFSVFEKKYRTEKSLRNSNVQVKIGINIQAIKKGTEFFIQEIGGGRPGGASRHSRMVTPDAAVITNIGTAHLGNFSSQSELANNKLAITEGMTPEGVLFLNGDDSLLHNSEITSSIKQNIIYYGIKNKRCDYYADNIHTEKNCITFDIISTKENKSTKCKINVMGIHNVLNAVCAYALADYYGIEESIIVKGLAAFQTSETRQNLITVGTNRLYIDCYNASLDSVKGALTTLSNIGNKEDKRIAVLGDITGMGEHQHHVNKELAQIIKSCKDVNTIICYGSNSKEILSYVIKNESNINYIAVKNRTLLERLIEENLSPNTIILFKGSSKMKLDEIIDSIYGLSLADQRYIDENKCTRYIKNNIEYHLFESYASVSSIKPAKETVKIPNNIIGKPVKIICDSACEENKKLKKLVLGENIRHIGPKAFKECTSLESIVTGNNVKMISAAAFEGCRLKSINMGLSKPIIEPYNETLYLETKKI